MIKTKINSAIARNLVLLTDLHLMQKPMMPKLQISPKATHLKAQVNFANQIKLIYKIN